MPPAASLPIPVSPANDRFLTFGAWSGRRCGESDVRRTDRRASLGRPGRRGVYLPAAPVRGRRRAPARLLRDLARVASDRRGPDRGLYRVPDGHRDRGAHPGGGGGERGVLTPGDSAAGGTGGHGRRPGPGEPRGGPCALI